MEKEDADEQPAQAVIIAPGRPDRSAERFATLTRIGRLLTAFEDVATTVTAVLVETGRLFPLRSTVLIELVEHQATATSWCDAAVPEARQRELVKHAQERLGYLLPAHADLATFELVETRHALPMAARSVVPPGGADSEPRLIALPLVPTAFEVAGVVLFELVAVDLDDDDLICAAAIVNHLAVALDAFRFRARNAAARNAQAVATLAGGVAHHFNNQLTVILLNNELLRSLSVGTEAMQEALTEIQHAGTRVVALANKLLAVGRRQRVTRQTIDANALIRSMMPHLSEIVEGAAEGVELSLASDVRRVEVDPAQLEVVVAALVLNAHEARRETHAIRIATHNAPSFGDRMTGEFVAISVKDRGTGMDQDTRDRMFDPFFSTKDPGLVAGLGLAIVDGIVSMNGGRIAVASDVGRGTTVTVFLPAAPRPNDHPRSVLVSSADPAVQSMVAQVLPVQDVVVVRAESWDATVHACSQHDGPIDVIVIDPDQSVVGEDLGAAIHRLRLLRPGAGVVVLVARPRQLGLPPGKAARGLVTLPKPYTPAQLGEAIRAAHR